MGDTIDINVQVAVDEVTINATPNNYIINVNRIIGEQVQSDWNETDDQAPDYIRNKPIIPAAQVNSDWNAISGVAEILNKPTIPAAVTKTSDLTNDGADGVNPFITLNDIPPSANTLDDVLTNGNTSFLDAKVGTLGLWDTGNSYYNKIGSIGNAFYFMRNDGATLFVTEAGYSRFSTDYGTLELSNAGIIGSKTINWPDASGTVALTSDIIAPTLDNVLTNGDTSLLNANIGILGLWDNANGGYSTIEVSDNSFSLKNTSADFILRAEQGILSLHQTSSITGNFTAYNITENRNYELPDQSGTIALTSDIPANGLPAGGTAGQILTKVDATDYNATWQENFADWTSVVKHTVKNNGLSGTITKGTAVYVTGSDGTNMLVGRASNASEATSSKTMGLMQSDITTTGGTQTGFVIAEGLIQGLNTAGQTAGDPVWLGVNGALIYGLVSKPYAPAHLVFIGIVTKVSAGNGEIFVKVQNGFELNEIHDVDLITTTPINGHLLGFDGTLWVNKTIAGWLGYTPANASGTTNYLPKFTGANALGNSLISESTNLININSASVLLDNNRFLRGKFVDGTVKDIIGINDGNEIVSTSVGAFHFTNIPNVQIDATAVPTFNLSNSAGALGQLILESGATGNINIRGNGGTRLITLSQNGQMAVSKGTVSLLAQQTIYPYATTIKGQVIKGFTGQTANLQEWQDSIGTVLAAVTAAGNVGIGTTAPAEKLHVSGASTVFQSIFESSNGAILGYFGGIQLGNNAASQNAKLLFSSAGDNILTIRTSYSSGTTNKITFEPGGTEVLRLQQNGSILIGTTANIASSKLTIESTTQGFLPPRMTNAQRIAIATPAVGLCVYCTDVVEGLYINKSTGWTYIG